MTERSPRMGIGGLDDFVTECERDRDILHAPGEGSYKKYKNGCRCPECRAASTKINTEYRIRRRERERAELQAQLVEQIKVRITLGGNLDQVASDVIRLVAKTESEWRRLGGIEPRRTRTGDGGTRA